MPKLVPIDNPALFLLELQRSSFASFAHKAWSWISGGQEIAWNWHLDAIAYELGRVAKGDNLRLLVTLPPRNGKSNMISIIWVAWMLGQDPRRNFVCVSYSDKLSSKMARMCLSIMQSPWYRELFPRTIISPKRSATSDFETTARGGRLATSVTGTLTGRGGDIIILDDVIKPEEANSDTTRDAVNDWYQSTLASRLNDKLSGAIILVMQRLHQYDLAGMVIEADDDWFQLKLSAIATEDEAIRLTRGRVHHRLVGDVLHPEREPLAVLEKTKAMMGTAAFAAQYQQDPVPAEGNIIRAAWLREYDPASLDRVGGEIIQSWDTASKDNPFSDYSVGITALVKGQNVYILDVVRKRLEFPDLVRAAINAATLHRPTALLIEDAASGQQLIQILRADQPAGVSAVIARKPEGDKVTRAFGVSPMIEGGRLFLPKQAHWLGEFKFEILGFPSSRHDDQVDALSQLLIWVRQKDMFRDTPLAGPIFYSDDRGWGDGYDENHSASPSDDPWL